MMDRKFQKIACEQTPQQPRLSYKRILAAFIIFFVSIRVLADIIIAAVPTADRNQGAAFSFPIFGSLQLGLISVALAALIALLLYAQTMRYAIPLVVILSAAANNIVERMRYGAVIDPIQILNWHGNGADIAIGIGIIFLLWGMMHEKSLL